jgi:hypothetical protein
MTPPIFPLLGGGIERTAPSPSRTPAVQTEPGLRRASPQSGNIRDVCQRFSPNSALIPRNLEHRDETPKVSPTGGIVWLGREDSHLYGELEIRRSCYPREPAEPLSTEVHK